VPKANDYRGLSVWAKLLTATVVPPSALATLLRHLTCCIQICQKCCIRVTRCRRVEKCN